MTSPSQMLEIRQLYDIEEKTAKPNQNKLSIYKINNISS